MNQPTLLADPAAIEIDAYIPNSDSITIRVYATQAKAFCPSCAQPSSSLKSRYVRSLADLPWHGVAVGLELHTRKFRCRNDVCHRKVFCERLPQVAASYARRTVRLKEVTALLGFALGGRAGSRAAVKLKLSASKDTVLRLIRLSAVRQTTEDKSPVKILGVDDFAFKRGERYGTILVDLEKHQPIDLLPDRKSESLQTWLAIHPAVEIISRDRASAYATGARLGAPDAVQIADRFHLLKNLLDGFEKFLSRQQPALLKASQTVFHPLDVDGVFKQSVEQVSSPTIAQNLVIGQKKAQLREREQRFKVVKKLHRAEVPVLTIARRLRMSRNTVKKFIASDSFPMRRQNTPRFSPIHRFLPHLRQRWAEGERSSRALWQEIRAQGYPGAEVTLRHFMQKWRVATAAEVEAHAVTKASPGRSPSVRQVKWLLFSPEKRKRKWEQQFADELCRQSTEIDAAQKLVTEFHTMLSDRQPGQLQHWLERARDSGIGEFVWFANGVEQDRKAVEAACSHEWNQGQVEGNVNRLKLLKRQMYGRAKFDLLRARVLHQG